MQAIHTKYIPATDRRGARIKAYTSDKRSVWLPVDYELSDVMRHFHVAAKLVHDYMEYAPSVKNMVYGDSADGKGYVFCFGESKVNPQGDQTHE